MQLALGYVYVALVQWVAKGLGCHGGSIEGVEILAVSLNADVAGGKSSPEGDWQRRARERCVGRPRPLRVDVKVGLVGLPGVAHLSKQLPRSHPFTTVRAAEARFYAELETSAARIFRADPGGELAGPWVAVYRL